VILNNQLNLNSGRELSARNFPGVIVQNSSVRTYPNGPIATSVLGGTNAAGAGSAGLEYQYQTLLAGSTVQPSTTIGFPHGGHTTAVKLAEVEQALQDGATELDMVINISQARSGQWDYVEREIRLLAETTHAAGAKIKVIFENAYHDDSAKIRLCEICGGIGVDWVKTSTGYAASGATLADLQLMRRHSPTSVQVKAAGGIRTLDALLEVRAIGVSRVGATRTAEMLDDCRQRLRLPAFASAAIAPIEH